MVVGLSPAALSALRRRIDDDPGGREDGRSGEIVRLMMSVDDSADGQNGLRAPLNCNSVIFEGLSDHDGEDDDDDDDWEGNASTVRTLTGASNFGRRENSIGEEPALLSSSPLVLELPLSPQFPPPLRTACRHPGSGSAAGTANHALGRASGYEMRETTSDAAEIVSLVLAWRPATASRIAGMDRMAGSGGVNPRAPRAADTVSTSLEVVFSSNVPFNCFASSVASARTVAVSEAAATVI